MLRVKPFPSVFFKNNREKLVNQFGEDTILFLRSADEMIRNADIIHPWRQDSSFFYYTGIDQPGCSLILVPEENNQYEEYLFIPPVDPEKEKWTGKMLTPDQATEISGIKKVISSSSFLPTFYRLQKWKSELYCEVNDQIPDQPLTQQHLLLADLAKRLPGLCLNKLGPTIARQRYLKQPEEIENIKRSLDIIQEALSAVLSRLKPGIMEYQIEAELVYRYLDAGCNRVGFEAIIAGGYNGTMLHYVSNHCTLNDGELVLIDTGAEYGMYSGDITRTYPVNGKFTDRQRHCYQAVLEVNKRFIDELKPGLTWNDLYKIADTITGEIYADYGFIKEPKKHVEVSFHRIGHFLGLDVHDVGSLNWPLEAGSLITVEPGLYLPDEGIGIRIEDNALFTQKGVEVLSEAIPKEIADIERKMARSF